MKRQLIVIILIAVTPKIFGQNNFGIKISGGLSKMSDSSWPDDSIKSTRIGPSFSAGLFYSLEFGKKSGVGAELLFLQIEGREKINLNLADSSSNVIGYIHEMRHNHISFVSLPIYYNLRLKNLTINLGFQTSFAITSGTRREGQVMKNGVLTSYKSKFNNLNNYFFDCGPRIGVYYKLTNRLALEGTYYLGINNIIALNTANLIWKIHQASIGLQYTLRTTAEKKPK